MLGLQVGRRSLAGLCERMPSKPILGDDGGILSSFLMLVAQKILRICCTLSVGCVFIHLLIALVDSAC